MGQFNKCPANWENVLEGIRKISYSDHDTTRDWEDDDDDILSPKDRRFAVLASSLLSSQTKEHVTRGATQRLRQKVDLPCMFFGSFWKPFFWYDQIKDLVLKLLVGFYIRKASNLKKIAHICLTKGGDIPNSIEELLSLPGIGPKIAHLVMIIAWNNVQGPDMCRYSCPTHLQSSWMGFEIRHKTENFNTRRNTKGAGNGGGFRVKNGFQ
ncbi:endonuclease III protein 2, chloroplastic [Trifolium repens]|nr:endonuclease III protein 2, chloroplastic [Trifolium repens]